MIVSQFIALNYIKKRHFFYTDLSRFQKECLDIFLLQISFSPFVDEFIALGVARAIQTLKCKIFCFLMYKPAHFRVLF